MKKNLIRSSCAIAFCLLSLRVALGCAVITVPSLTKFDSSEYIFIGEVVGVAGPIESEKFQGGAWGLKVRVKDSVHLPKSPASHFVVVPFDLESDCKDKGRSEDELLRYFPVGSEVRVIAKESKYAESHMADGNIRLEVLPDNLGSIARNYSGSGAPVTSVGGIYDYRSYVVGSPCEISEKDMPDYEANMRLPDFEYRKDLLRLKNAGSEKERARILEGLLYFPSSSDEFLNVTGQHLKNRKTIKRLNKEREVWKRLFLSKLVLSC
jgi:hypothetical protein